MNNQQKQAKICLNGTIKRLNLSENFEEFKKSCEKAFTLCDNELDNLLVSYIDDEDDKVIISNAFDYDQALLFIQNPNVPYLKIFLEAKCPGLGISVLIDNNSVNHEKSDLINTISNNNLKENKNENIESDPLRSGMSFNKADYLIINKDGKNDDNNKIRVENEKINKKLEQEQANVRKEEARKLFIDKLQKLEVVHTMRRFFDKVKSKMNLCKKLENIVINKQNFENELKKSTLNQLKENAKTSKLEEEEKKKEIEKEKELEKNEINDLLIKKIEDLEVEQIYIDNQDNNKIEINIIGSDEKETQVNDEKLLEELEKERRKQSIMERIRHKALEDYMKKEIMKENNNIEDKTQESKLMDQRVNNFLENSQPSKSIVQCEHELNIRENKLQNDAEINDKLEENDFKEMENQFRQTLNSSISEYLETKLEKFKKSMMQKTLEKSNQIIDKFFINLKDRESKKSNINNLNILSSKIQNSATHKGIRCDGCKLKPIIGDRYKCSICKDFDFCFNCEESNSNSININRHPHAFIRIRRPGLSSEEKIANLDLNNEIEIKNLENRDNVNNEDSSGKDFMLMNNSSVLSNNNNIEDFSAICITSDLELNHFLISNNSSTDNLRKMIRLKNTGTVAWPKPCFLSCIKDKSTILSPTIPISARIGPNDEINVEVKIDIPKEISPGKYYLYIRLYHPTRKNFFGDEICLTFNLLSEKEKERDYFTEYLKLSPIEKKKINILVKQMREGYDISTNVVKDEVIINALMKEKGDLEKSLWEVIGFIQNKQL